MGEQREPAPVRLAELVAAVVARHRSRLRPADGARAAAVPDRAAARASCSVSTRTTRAAVYYTALLVNVGCHSDAHEQAKWFGDDIALKVDQVRLRTAIGCATTSAMVRLLGAGSSPLHRSAPASSSPSRGRHDVDDMIAQHARAGPAARRASSACPPTVARRAWRARTSGGTARAGRASVAGDAIPLGVADRAAGRVRRGRAPHAAASTAPRELAERRAGTQFDPTLVADRSATDADEDLRRARRRRDLADGDRRRAGARPCVLDRCRVRRARCWRSPSFVDLKSPYMLGHSHGRRRARGGGRTPPRTSATTRCTTLHRAGLVHELRPAGRVERDLGQARPARRRRVGAGAPAPVLHRADAAAVRRAGPARRGSPCSTASASTAPGYPRGLPGSAISRARPGSSAPPTPTRRCASPGPTARR